MYPVLKIMHMLNFLDMFSVGITNGIRADLSQYGVVRGRTKQKLVGM